MVKSTYVLDVETADQLERLAREWQVSKSEVLRRVIRSASVSAVPDRLATFRKLQESEPLNSAQADSWSEAVSAERRAQQPTVRRRK
jgi:hypothetical protein